MTQEYDELETYKNINIASLRNGTSACTYMYYLIRHCDSKGKGYIDYAKFITFIKTLGLTRNNFYTALNNPACHTFFILKTNNSSIEYRSIAKVCDDYGIIPGQRHFFALPHVKSLKEFKAHCYSSLFKSKNNREPVTMSRETITELTGLCVNTQIQYEKIAHIEKRYNMASAVIPELVRDNPHMRQDFIDGLPCKDMFRTEQDHRIVWQLPNAYLPQNVRVYKGKSHRANKKIKRVDEGLVPYGYGKRATSSKVFYRNVSENAMFTDTQSSFINTGYQVPTEHGKANLFRYNPYAPTDDPEIAVANARMTEHKVVVLSAAPISPIIVETI